MRFLILVLLMAVSGCRCSPATPQPVKLRIVNSTRSPIYVDATNGKLGLTVQREVGGAQFPFDDLACECRSCARSCDTSCSCPDAGLPTIRRLEAGERIERTWDGVIQLAGNTRCSDGTCLDPVNAPLNEQFTLELCFGVQSPTGVVFDGGVGTGQLPMVSRECTTRQFAPQDLEVEIGPARGAACTTAAECKGKDELCLDGACTTGCPANSFPAIGSDWVLNVASPDNMGFFEMTSRPGGNQFEGTGTLSSVVYQSNSLLLGFSRAGPVVGEVLTGRVQIKLPVGRGAPLTAGTMVKATVVDDGETKNPVRAFVLRDAASGEVLFAADMAQNGERLLLDTDIAPFKITDGTVPVGCTQDACGRFVQFPVTFSRGQESVSVLPGEEKSVGTGSSRWTLLNVGNGTYDASATSCPVAELRPFVFWKSSAP